jgi:hypothetical protein
LEVGILAMDLSFGRSNGMQPCFGQRYRFDASIQDITTALHGKAIPLATNPNSSEVLLSPISTEKVGVTKLQRQVGHVIADCFEQQLKPFAIGDTEPVTLQSHAYNLQSETPRMRVDLLTGFEARVANQALPTGQPLRTSSLITKGSDEIPGGLVKITELVMDYAKKLPPSPIKPPSKGFKKN